MVARTHVSLGVAISAIPLPILFYTNIISVYNDLLFYFITVITASLLPDIDHPNATLSQGIFKPFAKIVQAFSSHRGFTHNYKGLILITLLLIYLNPPIFIHVAFIIGYLSHLYGDSMTVSGLDLFATGNPIYGTKVRFYAGRIEEDYIYIKLNLVIILEIWVHIIYLVFPKLLQYI